MVTSVNEYKDELKISVKKILRVLNEFKNLSTTNFENEEINKHIKNINAHIYDGIINIRKDIEDLFEASEWDNFNIAFFGETGAGKSTTIEALTKGNGISIGDGNKDFTKEIKISKFGRTNFLDMPGIEGNEGKLIQEIKKAVEKAHIIFYIIGTNKELEEGTIRKVKTYLKDEAKVYSVLNVRGVPSIRKWKSTLIEGDVKKVEKRITMAFKKILRNHYQGNVIANSYIGFLAVGDPKIGEHIEQKKKVLDYFPSYQAAYEYSNLKSIEDLVSNLSQESSREIIVSNTYKFLKSLENIISKILYNKKNFDIALKQWEKLILDKLNESEEIIVKYHIEMLNTARSTIDSMENDIINFLYKGIDNEWNKEDIEKGIKEIKSQYEKKLNIGINNISKRIDDEINFLLTELKKQITILFKSMNLDGDIDINLIIKELQVSFDDTTRQILTSSVGTILIGFATGFWLLAPLLIFVSVLGADGPEDKKRKLKRKAYEGVKKSIEQEKLRIINDIKNKISYIQRTVKKIIKEYNLYLKEVKCFGSSMSEKIKELQSNKAELCTLLAKYILGDNITTSYIDLQLDKILLIGNSFNEKDIAFLRVKNTIYYRSWSEFLNNIKCTFDKQWLILDEDDEFTYRALNALKDKLGIKGARRKLG